MPSRRCSAPFGLALTALCTGCLDWSSSGAARSDAGGAEVNAPSLDAGGVIEAGPAVEPEDAGEQLTAHDAAAAPDAGEADAAGERGRVAGYCRSLPSDVPCADFDTTSIADWSWPEISSAPGTGVTAVPDPDLPGNQVLRARVGAQADESAMLAFELPRELGAAELDFELKTNAPLPTEGATILFKLQADVGDDYPGVSLALTPEGTVLAVENAAGENGVEWTPYGLPALPARWTHVHVRVVYGAHGSLLAQYDQGPIVRFDDIRIEPGEAAMLSFKLGLYSQNPVAAEALFDDVVLRLSLP